MWSDMSDFGAPMEAETCSVAQDTTSTASSDASDDAQLLNITNIKGFARQWSTGGSAVVTPRGHRDDAEGNPAAWSRMRTPSPEGRYTSTFSSGTGPCQFSPPQFSPPHFMMPQWPAAPYSEVAVVAVLAPPPPRPLPLDELLLPRRRQPRRGERGVEARAQRRRSSDAPSQISQTSQASQVSKASQQASQQVSQQASADTPVLSIGSVGHPYSCGPPCKYSRKGHACKDGADCSHCHACVWRRSDERRAQARGPAR